MRISLAILRRKKDSRIFLLFLILYSTFSVCKAHLILSLGKGKKHVVWSILPTREWQICANMCSHTIVFTLLMCVLGRVKSLISHPFLKLCSNLDIEDCLWKEGVKHVIGVDEAGRGPLAGPVFAAAVSLAYEYDSDSKSPIPVADSKKLSEGKREEIYRQLIGEHSSLSYAISTVSHSRIDEINILEASMEAMHECVTSLCSQNNWAPEDCFILVDGKKGPKFTTMRSKTYIQGDARVYSIAAASIIAKTQRDAFMREMDSLYSGYGFGKNKGYGTKEHLLALHKLGPCELHRLSFKPLKGRPFSSPIPC